MAVVCSVSVHVLVLCVTKQRVEVFTVPTPHQVNGRPVTGLTRSKVVSLLRQAQGDVTLVISKHEVVDEQDAEEVRPHPLKSCDLWRYSVGLNEEIFISFFVSSSSPHPLARQLCPLRPRQQLARQCSHLTSPSQTLGLPDWASLSTARPV